MPASDFASLLRRYRRRSGLTQEDLAGRARLSVASINETALGRRLRRERRPADADDGLHIAVAVVLNRI